MRVLAVALATLGAVLLNPATAVPCSYARGLEISGSGAEWTTPTGGPLVINVTRFGPDRMDYEDGELELTVSDGTTLVPGTLDLINEPEAGQLLIWTPEAPLTEQTYDIELSHVGHDTLTGTLSIVAMWDLPQPDATLQQVTEQPVEAGDKHCCDTSPICTHDTCSSGPPVCEMCWFDDVEYVTSLSIRVTYPNDLRPQWTVQRRYKVEADGSERLVPWDQQLSFTEGEPWPRCVVVAYYDYVRDLETRTEVCADEDMLQPISREPVDNSDIIAVCSGPIAPGTDADPDGEPNEPAPGQGCATTSPEPHLALALLIPMGYLRRRNRARRKSDHGRSERATG